MPEVIDIRDQPVRTRHAGNRPITRRAIRLPGANRRGCGRIRRAAQLDRSVILVVRAGIAQVAGRVVHPAAGPHPEGKGGHMLLEAVVAAAGEHVVGAYILAGDRTRAVAERRGAQVGLVIVHGNVGQTVPRLGASRHVRVHNPSHFDLDAGIRRRHGGRTSRIAHARTVSRGPIVRPA
ncbi:MAG: hypothetical protein BWY57_02792 [Betaproteobacteria bacterium ADurb.Bin341]|nr:MAG: hypothetical protein BWY57_02792 [Betaproteobacteria bacterium ADurb.Bin341]